MKTKHAVTQIKAAGDGLEPGQFTGYAAVFGNVDSTGDSIVKGAFANTLTTKSTFPVYWSHGVNDPDMNIGKTLEIREDDHGLFVKVQLDLESAKGAQVHKLIKEGRVSQMSFMYDVIKHAQVGGGKYDGGYTELQELKLHEVSVVAVGANQETELLAVKSSTSPATVDHLRTAYKALGDLLAAIPEDVTPSPKSSDVEAPEAPAEDPVAAKSRKDAYANLALLDASIDAPTKSKEIA